MKKLLYIIWIALLPLAANGQKISTYVSDGDTVSAVSDTTWIEVSEIGATNATKAVRLSPIFAPKASPTFTGTITIGDAGISEAELEILDGGTISTGELNYLDNVTANVQTQLDAKLNEADTVDLASVVKILTDTSLHFSVNYGVGNAGDTAAFNLDSTIWYVEWEGSQTLNITKISAKCRGATPDMDLAFLSNTTPTASGATAVLSSDMTVTTTTTWTDATSFNDAVLSPGETLMLRIDQTTAKATGLTFNIFGYLTE